MSFQQGLSGLSVSSKALDIISNNVANTNTIGFKSGSAIFSDVFAASLTGSISGKQVGVGATLGAVPLSQLAAAAELALASADSAQAASWQQRVQALGEQTQAGLLQLLAALQPPPREDVAPAADDGALRQQLEALSALLADADMAATDHFAEMHASHEMRWADEMLPLAQAIAALDFERALAECRKLSQRLADA